MDGAPTRHAAPGPEADTTSLAAAALQLADAVYEVEGFEQHRRHWHSSVDAAAAFLEAFEHQHAGGEVDMIDGQRQRF
jgi:hypothetical protein